MQEKSTRRPRPRFKPDKSDKPRIHAQILPETVMAALGLDTEPTNNRLLNQAIDAFQSDPARPASDLLLNRAMRIIENGEVHREHANSAMYRLVTIVWDSKSPIAAEKIVRNLIALANNTKDVWTADEAMKNVFLLRRYVQADLNESVQTAHRKNLESLKGIVRKTIRYPECQEMLDKAIGSFAEMIDELDDQEALIYVGLKSRHSHARNEAVEKIDADTALIYLFDKSDHDDVREAIVDRFEFEYNISALQSLALNTRHREAAGRARKALDALRATVDTLKPPLEKVPRVHIPIEGEPGDTMVDPLPSVAGEISQADGAAVEQEPEEPKVIVRDSVILDLFGSDITEVYSEVLHARERYDFLNKEYWCLVDRYRNEQTDHDAVLQKHEMLSRAWAAVESKERKYENTLIRISQDLEEKDVNALEQRLLGEIAYKKEIVYRLGNAREDLIHAQQDGDEDAIPVAERAVWKYENILQKLAEEGRWQDSISETNYSIKRSEIVASRRQEQLEIAAVAAYQKAKQAKEALAGIDEAIEKSYSMIDSSDSRIQARAEYKEALDRLRVEYGGASYERIHDLVEKRAIYEEALKDAYGVFKADIDSREMDYQDVLRFGEQIINSGEYKTSAPNSRERLAAEFFHASFELEHARELLTSDPMQSIQLEKCNVPLRGGAWSGEMNTIMWFDDMIKRMQSDPPTPEQLQSMTRLRNGRQHRKNRDLNQQVWGIMSREFVFEEQHESCPKVVTVPKDMTLMQADGVYTHSHYIAIKENPDLDADDRSAIMAHEQAHYLAALNGGLGGITYDGKLDMVWQAGNRRVRGAVWLHEGMTELLTQQLIRKHGIRSKRVGYPREVIACFYLQKLVGEDVLRKAYLSGDFTDVRNRLEDQLGYGTFDELLCRINCFTPGAILPKALEYFGIDYRSWENDEIVRIAKQQLAER